MILSLPELRYAWELVRRGTPNAGIDGVTVNQFKGVLTEKLDHLHQQLLAESYFPQPAKGFYLAKRNGGNRLIGIPTVRDRIVQRWLLETLYQPLEDEFADCSYAYRPGRNIQMAVDHYFFYYQHQPIWTIKADIASFFDSICWALLLSAIAQLPVSERIPTLIEGQLKSGMVVNGRQFCLKQGVLQGAVLSGALANLYLAEFDRTCLQEGLNLVRYGDDFAIACRSQREAEQALAQIKASLGRLYLQLQPSKTHIFTPKDEFTFLGYLFRDGQVFAPPPPPPSQRHLPLDPSGRPRARAIYIHSFLSRPPKVCPVKREKPKERLVEYHPQLYFAEIMTTLYVTDQGSYLKAQQYQFQVFHQKELRVKVPVNRVSHIVLFGCCNLSHGAVRLALKRRIPVLYLSHRGRYFGRLQTEGQAKVAFLSQQVRHANDPEFVRQTAETIIRAKLHNSRMFLMRLKRRHKTEALISAVAALAEIIDTLPQADSLDALRGYEGHGAKVYFRGLGSTFADKFAFEQRTKRRPQDPTNSLLSLGYTLLSQNVHSFIEAVGLHTHYGNLHVPRDNHPALVSDLVEEFRAQVVDSLVVYLINKKIFKAEDFTPQDERGGVYLHPGGLRKFLKHWEEKLQTMTTHPYSGHRVALRRCLELQVREYVACLMGEVDGYRAMLWSNK